MSKLVTIGNVEIGETRPCRVIAEIGLCHRGDLGLAIELAEAAAAADCDFIKTECYVSEKHFGKFYRGKHAYQYGTLEHGTVTEDFWEATKVYNLTRQETEKLKSRCDSLGKAFFATAISRDDIDFLIDIGACAIKLSSGEMERYDLFRYVAERGAPLFFDTAVTYLSEVVRCYEEYRLAGGDRAVVMHNPCGYPAPDDLTDLRRIRLLVDLLDIPVGLSCHSLGRDVSLVSIGLGATIMEKCICPDRKLPYVEYAQAENAAEMGEYVRAMRTASVCLGQPMRLWPKNVWENNFLGRQGALAARDIKQGEVIRAEDVHVAYPGFGIRGDMVDVIPGRVARRDLAEGEAIAFADLGDVAAGA